MTKAKTFLHALRNTFTSQAYYKDIIKASFSFSLKFFLSYFALFSLISTVIISITVFGPLSVIINNFPQKLQQAYPDELIINIKNGEVTTNVKEPYVIPMERLNEVFTTKDHDSNQSPKNFIVIDTNGSIDNFDEYNTAVLLTKKTFSYKNNNRIESSPIDKSVSTVINESVIQNFANSIKAFIPFIIPLIVTLSFFFIFIFFAFGKLIYLLFGALLIYVVARISKQQLTYKKSYQLGLHIIIVVTTIVAILDIFQINTHFPFAQSILLVILTLIVLPRSSATPAKK